MNRFTPLEDLLANVFLDEAVPLPFMDGDEIVVRHNKKITVTDIRRMAACIDTLEIAPSPMRNALNACRDRAVVRGLLKSAGDALSAYSKQREAAGGKIHPADL